jgi:hypothetical protein
MRRLVCAALWCCLGCHKPAAAPLAVPDAGPAVAAVDAEKVRALDESQKKLDESLAKLEALKAQSQVQPAAPAVPDASTAEAPVLEAPDAGPGRARQWAAIAARARSSTLAESLDDLGRLWEQERAGLSVEGANALAAVITVAQAKNNQPWDDACAAAVEALDKLPETDARGRPLLAMLWASLANRAVLSKDLKLTRKLAKHALQLEEVLPYAFHALARAAYAESDFDEAEKFWERAARGSNDPAEMKSYRGQLEQLERDRATFGRGRRASEHFVVLYDPREDELASKEVLQMLDDARTRVGGVFDDFPVELLSVALYAGTNFDQVNHISWAGAFYDGRVRIPSGGVMANSLRFKETLFHEYAHGVFEHVTGEGRRTAPTWLNEGLASVSGNLVAPVPLGGCRMGHTFPLRSLEKSFGNFDRAHAHPAYLEARHAAERLRETFGERRVQDLLKETAKKKSFEAAFESALGVSYAKWAQDFDTEAGHLQ